MTRYRRARTIAVLVAVVTLILTACGSRIDHDNIVSAAGSSGVNPNTAFGVPGEVGPDGNPLGEELVADGNPRDAGAAGTREPGVAADEEGDIPGIGSGTRGAPSGTGNTKGHPIVVGNVGTYSGPIGSMLRQAPRAVQAWAASVNARGGLNGHPVKVIVMDDGGDAAKSRSQVQELVEQHKVVALVGNMPLAASLKAWQPYIEEKKIPVIGGSCIDGWNDSPMLFSQCPSLDSSIFGTVLVGAKHGKSKKFGAFVCTEDPSCSYMADRWFKGGQAERAGLDPRYQANISITQPDYTAECIQARNAGVELLSVMGDPNTWERVAASCHRQNYNPQFIENSVVSANLPSKPGFSDALSPQLVMPFAGVSSPVFREFEDAWRKYGSGVIEGSASMGWAGAKIFEKAARTAESDISSVGLVRSLYTFKNERFGGMTVPLSYGPKGTSDSHCIFFMKAKGGRWTAPAGDRPLCW